MAVSNIQSGLYKALAEAGRHFATKLSDAVSQNNLPKAISDAISIDSPVVGDTESYVDVKIDLETAPMARAFEWGSGIHRTRGGEKETYRIPKKGTTSGLAFKWDKVDETTPTGRKFRGILPDGRAGFTFVDHPGVAPRPYIIPTIKAEKEQIKRILAREFKASILLGVEKITVIE